MTGLADFPVNSGVHGRRGHCKRCNVKFDGMRGVIMIRLFRKPDGRADSQETLASRATTMCEDCTIEVWDQVNDALQPQT